MNDRTKNQFVLKPCPFCGGAAKIDSIHGGTRWLIYCLEEDDCPVTPELRSYQENKDVAIAAWNTRADSPAAPVTNDEKSYFEKAVDTVLRQGIASQSEKFKHQKLCEALEWFTKYRSSLQPRKEQE